ncbi:hypothetical protein EJ02DRAFT_475877 [Clathrospora elynae]|uniref:Uncharacterized protein n=1 Tax=Clathrospora elynae TaxID=706981 RepID=A0A6A5SY04_9PLEO|nr:hypothetical protein EJ02DRAFT_475877 [Clathrospora elynae]
MKCSLRSQRVYRKALIGHSLEKEHTRLLKPQGGHRERDRDLSSARRALATLTQESVTGPIIKADQNRPAPLRTAPYKVVTNMSRISCSAINDPSTSLSSLAKSHISKFTPVAALIWAQVLRARLPLLISPGTTPSTLAVVADLRTRLVPRQPHHLSHAYMQSSSRHSRFSAPIHRPRTPRRPRSQDCARG